MRICPSCQATFPDHISFCSNDGSPLKATTADWTEGTIVRGRYRILSKVGEGGMGAVYKVLHTGFDELRAIKVISPELVADEAFVRRFKQEAFISRKLQHPNAVRVDDIDEAEDGRPFIVMEYIEGQSLKQLILEGGPMAAPRVCSIAKQVAAALEAAHQLGMVHRDIKPENIVLVQTPEGEQAKVLDFGIAKVKEARAGKESGGMTLTGVGVVIGTPQYMSPEQAKGMRGDELDGRSDIYSLGVVMYEMLTADLPFKATTTMEMLLSHMQKPPRPIHLVRPDLLIPEPLGSLVMRVLQKRRETRPQSAAALIEEIWRVEKGMPVATPWRVQPSPAPVQEARRPQPPAAPSTGTLVGPGLPQAPTPPPRPTPPTAPPSQIVESSPWVRWSLIGLAAVVLGYGAWYLASHRAPALFEQHLEEAKKLESRKLYPQAEQEYRAAAGLDPQNSDVQAALGNVLIQERKWDDGIAAYREALRLKPDDPAVHNNLGVALQTAGNMANAADEYREALRLKPDYIDAHNNLGDALQKQNDFDGAIDQYHEVLRLNPNDADAHYRLGVAFNKKGSADEAIAEYREAIRIKPGFALAHFGLGAVLYSNKGDQQGGLEQLRTAYMLDPDDPEIRASYQKLLER